MYVRVILQQQTQNTRQTTQRSADRAERPERAEQPERPERPEAPERPEVGTPASSELREQIRDQFRAVREAAKDMEGEIQAEQAAANQVRIRNGVPVAPGGPGGVIVHTGAGEDMIPPQAVDLAYGLFVMLAVMVIGWPLSRAFGRRLERSAPITSLPPVVTEQLLRIEQTVEAMAVEVERISEAQRYLAKLQTSQGEPASLPAGDRG